MSVVNGIMLYKPRSIWQSIHKKQQEYYTEIYLFLFLRDEDFVSKTINDSNIHLEKFPASKVRQLAKKIESSKSTARHIKKMSSEPQATQVNLLRHQRTEIPPNKSKWEQFKNNTDHKIWNTKLQPINTKHNTRRSLIPGRFFKVKTDVTNVVIPSILRDFSVLLANISAEIVINLVILVACATRSKILTRRGEDHPKHTSWPVVDYLHTIIPYTVTQVITHQVMNLSVCRWSYKLKKLMQSTQHLGICLQIWNIKLSHTRTKPRSCEPELTLTQM